MSMKRPDVILVPYPGQLVMPIVGVVARWRRVPVILDLFISLYDTLVCDREMFGERSAVARLARLLDMAACRVADLVLADTPSDAAYFAKLAGASSEQFRILWLGAQEDVFYPRPKITPAERLVVFHGTFIPLQGLDVVIKAAKLVEADNIRFRILGDGQVRDTVEALMSELGTENVELLGMVDLSRVPEVIASATVCLGIFGTTDKAGRVVPNKVFECLAVGRPVVTGDTPGIRSAFGPNEVLRVPVGNPAALADCLRLVCSNANLRGSVAAAGHKRFVSSYSQRCLSNLLQSYVTQVTRN